MATADKGFQAAVIAEFEAEREKRGISYREIEKRTGINTGTLSKWIKGGTEIRVQALYELCQAIGVDIFVITKRAQDRLK